MYGCTVIFYVDQCIEKILQNMKISFLQEMESSGGEGRKKGSEDDLSRTSHEIHDGHRPKVLYLKDIFN